MPNIYYMCDTGVGYTGDEAPELVEHEDVARYTQQQGVMAYKYHRMNKPHEMFPPCTSCASALLQSSEGNKPEPCRLDEQCPLSIAREQAICIDCGLDLVACATAVAAQSLPKLRSASCPSSGAAHA